VIKIAAINMRLHPNVLGIGPTRLDIVRIDVKTEVFDLRSKVSNGCQQEATIPASRLDDIREVTAARSNECHYFVCQLRRGLEISEYGPDLFVHPAPQFLKNPLNAINFTCLVDNPPILESPL
jgi:hypothetical protein